MGAALRDAGSFRDPGGTVLVSADRVFRTVTVSYTHLTLPTILLV